MKLKKTILATVAISMAMSSTVFAGTWRTGAEPNQNKKWYDFDNGSYAANGWQWIDGDNNGVAECYYFDAEGWMLANTTTPDGYQVNADGAWTENGIVQTQAAQVQAQVSAADIDYSWLQSDDGTVNYDVIYSAMNMASMFGSDWMEFAKNINPDAKWEEVFNRLQIPENLGADLNFGQAFTYTVTTPAGMTENDGFHAGAVAMAKIMLTGYPLESLNWDTSMDENGVITVTVVGSTAPVDYNQSWDDGDAAA